MARSEKLQKRIALGKEKPLSAVEYDIMVVLADIIENTPKGQRTPAMSELLAKVRD